METLNIINNELFQQYALAEALKVISADTGISLQSLVKQFPTNVELQNTCAKIVVETAKLISNK